MANPQSIASSQPLLKVLYPDGVSIPSYKQSKLIGLMKKDTTFYGEGTKYVVVSIAPGSGGSASISDAISNQDTTREVRFSLGRKTLYEVGSLTGETIAAARDKKGAIVDVLRHSMDRARYAFGRAESVAVWRNGGGARGKIAASSNVATDTITLTNLTDGVGFFKGMYLQLSSDDGTGGAGVRAPTKVRIGRLQRDTSGLAKLTIDSGNWNQISGAATGDFIFRAGDYGLYPQGVQAWNPTTEPTTSDSFLGINRGTAGDVNYLSGWRVTGTGQTKASTLINAGAEAHNAAIVAELSAFLNPLDMRDAFLEQSSYRYIDVATDIPKIGYRGVEMQTPIGDMKVFSEPDVPRGFFWLTDPGMWTRRSAGDVPMLLDFDGVKMFLRNPTSDDYQYRLGSYFNYENAEPGQVVVGSF